MTEEEIEEEGSLEFIFCPKCYCKLKFEDWVEYGCPNCVTKGTKEGEDDGSRDKFNRRNSR